MDATRLCSVAFQSFVIPVLTWDNNILLTVIWSHLIVLVLVSSLLRFNRGLLVPEAWEELTDYCRLMLMPVTKSVSTHILQFTGNMSSSHLYSEIHEWGSITENLSASCSWEILVQNKLVLDYNYWCINAARSPLPWINHKVSYYWVALTRTYLQDN